MLLTLLLIDPLTHSAIIPPVCTFMEHEIGCAERDGCDRPTCYFDSAKAKRCGDRLRCALFPRFQLPLLPSAESGEGPDRKLNAPRIVGFISRCATILTRIRRHRRTGCTIASTASQLVPAHNTSFTSVKDEEYPFISGGTEEDVLRGGY